MKEFFHGWRRKAGCVTLVMALGFAGEWMRSPIAHDVVSFSFLSRGHRFSTHEIGIFWASYDDSTTCYPSFATYPNEGGLYEFIAILARIFRDDHLEMRIIPYWQVLLPLTMLSAYLMLWKPLRRLPQVSWSVPTRLTNGHSKTSRNHGGMLALHLASYNWYREHSTLKTTPVDAGTTADRGGSARLVSNRASPGDMLGLSR